MAMIVVHHVEIKELVVAEPWRAAKIEYAHLVGGIVGAAAGYYLRTQSEKSETSQTPGVFSNLILGGGKKKD